MMNHKQKIDFLMKDEKLEPIVRSLIAPPLFKLLWKLGINIKPPIFMSFLEITLFMGLSFGFLTGIITTSYLFSRGLSIYSLLIWFCKVTIGGGGVYGVSMGLYYRYKKKNFDIPPWKEYGTVSEET